MNTRIHFSEEEGVGILTFDKADSAANIFDAIALDELAAHLNQLEARTDLKGLVLISAKNSIFIAGADISQFANIEDDSSIRLVISRGQQLFNRLADLPFVTVAAIHGAALGGGCEIALACDYRLASPDRKTKIGLPEVNLGILPAWGGSYRLPRLMGLPMAFDMILGGKSYAAKKAKKFGLVDLIVPREHLIRIAKSYVAKGKPTRKKKWKTNNALMSRVIASKAAGMVRSKTHGHYPAPLRAIKVLVEGLGSSRERAMKLEEDALVDLVKTSVCQNLVKIFFLQERAKKSLSDAEPTARINSVAVIGAGVMGAGIAQWASARGQRVILKDINPEQLSKGMASIGKVYGQALKRRIFSKAETQAGLDRISPVHQNVPLKVDMIIEAATENMELKKKIFKGLEDLAGEDTILATNTSALSIEDIAASVDDPTRVVGVHFFNPVSKMQLVEVIHAPKTNPAVLARAVRYVQAIGRFPVVVKDSPGFLVNRILMPYLIEAVCLFEGGAEPEKIDRTMLDFGMPMGPLRLIDEVGLDVSQHVAAFFKETFGDRLPSSGLLEQMLEQGLLGRKSGKGFYRYGGKGDPDPNQELRKLVSSSKYASLRAGELRARMVGLMVNESAMCLEEGVVEAPEDVDFGMIMGTGFAPFRGGPLRYAESRGLDEMLRELEELSKTDRYFVPCQLLRDKAQANQKFYT